MSYLPPVVCRRTRVLFVGGLVFYLPPVVCRRTRVLFVGGLVSYLPPVVCRRTRVLFVGGLVSYLRYLCLFAYNGVQHIVCCVFALFFVILCTLWCQFRWIVPVVFAPSVFSKVYQQNVY